MSEYEYNEFCRWLRERSVEIFARLDSRIQRLKRLIDEAEL